MRLGCLIGLSAKDDSTRPRPSDIHTHSAVKLTKTNAKREKLSSLCPNPRHSDTYRYARCADGPTGSIELESPDTADQSRPDLAMDPIKPPTKPCHNCRRQRLRCDRSYPHCNKCIAAGKECLGYGKLFRWTGAVASRGKLAGRTSSAPVDAAGNVVSQAPGEHAKQGQLDFFAPSTSSSAPCSSVGTPVSSSMQGSGGDMQLVLRSPSPESFVSSPWTLADPLYQDMQHSHRYYLSYCECNTYLHHLLLLLCLG